MGFSHCCENGNTNDDDTACRHRHHHNPTITTTTIIFTRQMANEALREKEALAADMCRRDVADALRQRDQERDRAAEEASLRSDLEAELQHLRAELEESRAARDEARANLGVVAAACREADAKSRELQEHRRVLAREVWYEGGGGGGVDTRESAGNMVDKGTNVSSKLAS